MQSPGCKVYAQHVPSRYSNISRSLDASRQSKSRSRQQSFCKAASSEVSLFTDSGLSGPGLGLSGPGSSSKKPSLKIEDVSLESEARSETFLHMDVNTSYGLIISCAIMEQVWLFLIVFVSAQAGLDYTKLRDLLAEGKFQDADDETRAVLIKLAGPGAVDRKWVYFSEVSKSHSPFETALVHKCSTASSVPLSLPQPAFLDQPLLPCRLSLNRLSLCLPHFDGRSFRNVSAHRPCLDE